VTVTLLTRPAARETLQSFHDHIRPMGPGWNGAGIELGRPDPSESPAAAFLAWFLACVVVYGAVFGVGYLLYGHTAGAVACLATAALAAWGVLRTLPRVGLR
jgi:hypothetical protein